MSNPVYVFVISNRFYFIMISGKEFKILRKGLGLSQDGMAKKIKKSRATISNWEKRGDFAIPVAAEIKVREIYRNLGVKIYKRKQEKQNWQTKESDFLITTGAYAVAGAVIGGPIGAFIGGLAGAAISSEDDIEMTWDLKHRLEFRTNCPWCGSSVELYADVTSNYICSESECGREFRFEAGRKKPIRVAKKVG